MTGVDVQRLNNSRKIALIASGGAEVALVVMAIVGFFIYGMKDSDTMEGALYFIEFLLAQLLPAFLLPWTLCLIVFGSALLDTKAWASALPMMMALIVATVLWTLLLFRHLFLSPYVWAFAVFLWVLKLCIVIAMGYIPGISARHRSGQ